MKDYVISGEFGNPLMGKMPEPLGVGNSLKNV
jgi:hypothetical protein